VQQYTIRAAVRLQKKQRGQNARVAAAAARLPAAAAAAAALTAQQQQQQQCRAQAAAMQPSQQPMQQGAAFRTMSWLSMNDVHRQKDVDDSS